MESLKPKPAGPLSVRLIVIAALVVVGGTVAWYWNYLASRQVASGPMLTAEAKAYVRYLQLSEVDMKAHESYLRQQVVEIIGKITNFGDRPLKLVEINCVFYNAYGQVVLRERVPIVGQRMGGLKPGETKNFRLPFDNLPEGWNQGLPQLVIAQIVFG
jgi:hypothetical protein